MFWRNVKFDCGKSIKNGSIKVWNGYGSVGNWDK